MTISLTLVILGSFGVILYFKVSRPIKKISRRMSEYVTDRENEKHSEKMVAKGNDEFALMVRSFNTMTDEIDHYLDDIEKLTRDKHTQETELNIARGIQMGLLLPNHIDKELYGIDTYIVPARDVGGDLYDYCETNDGKIFAAIADVSGKGISAALFMSRAVTLLHQYALAGFSPSKILELFNHMLCMRNPGGLFITAFVVIYDPSTGILTYSNAGHNLPYILGDELITLEDAHGVAAGLFDEEEYEEASVSVAPDSILFMYTDGVNEAKNVDGAFYTTERLEKMLTECIKSGSTDILNDILCDLNQFTQDAEQNDDITMLTMRFKPRPAETVLRLMSEKKEIVSIRSAIGKLPVSEDLKKTLFLAAEEIFINICSYAYDTPGEVEIRLSADDRIKMVFADSGSPFDPTVDVPDIEEYDHETRIGGLGRFLTFSIADEYHYEYRDGKNILTLYFERGECNDDHKNT